MGVKGHKKKAPKVIRFGIVTASTTRSIRFDESGQWMAKRAVKEGNEIVSHQVVTDEAGAIKEAVLFAIEEKKAQVVIVTGGTGVTSKDVSIEAVTPLFTKTLTAFGPLFAQLSYEQIDSAALLSRAAAGVVDNRAVAFCIPGSIKACKLACSALIFPEAGHIVKHLGENVPAGNNRDKTPCDHSEEVDLP